MAATAGGTRAVVDGARLSVDEGPWPGSSMAGAAAETPSVGAGEPVWPVSVIAGSEDGRVVVDAEADVEDPPWVGETPAGGDWSAAGLDAGGSGPLSAGADAAVGEDGVSAAKTGEGVDKSPELRASGALGVLAPDAEPGVSSATKGGVEIGRPKSLKVQYHRPAVATSTPTIAAAKPLLFLSLIRKLRLPIDRLAQISSAHRL
jgi:hypothetical protein